MMLHLADSPANHDTRTNYYRPCPMFSILIPTWNNLALLQLCVRSIRENSAYDHQIIVHVNDGSDGTLEWVRAQGITAHSFAAEYRHLSGGQRVGDACHAGLHPVPERRHVLLSRLGHGAGQ